MKKKAIFPMFIFVLVNSIVMAETIQITKVPTQLPRNLGLSSYSPLLEFDYSGLEQENYTLKVWLLNRGPWYCASAQICEKTFPVNNSDGRNSSGKLRIVQNMDVYNYSNMDFVARLYSSSGVQVDWDEFYVTGVPNRPPKLNFIPTQNCVSGQNLTFLLTATDPEENSVTHWASGLPEGAVLENNGAFNWTPDREGTYEIYVSADDGTTYDSQKVNIIVGPKPEFAEVNIPPCGTDKNVIGRVENIQNVLDYRIVCYIFISGSGWWVKPYADERKIPIRPDGSFEVDITTGGIDELATIVYLGVCHKDAAIPALSGTAMIPEDLPVLVSQKHFRNPAECHRIIEFSGYRWYVKNSGLGTLGPGPCHFSDSQQNVFLDENGYLHLQLPKNGTQWNCAEIICLEEMGYGTFTFELISDPSAIDKNVVLGLFTWADDAKNGKEIDIEYGRWGDSKNRNGQFAVQPWDSAGHLFRFEFSSKNNTTSHSFRWQKGKALFQVHENNDKWPSQNEIISNWAYAGETPEPGRVHPRINFWLFNNQPPSDGQSQFVIIKNFQFRDLARATALPGIMMLLLDK